MAKFEERNKFWSIFYSPLVFFVLLVAFLFMVRAMWRVYNYESISSRERDRIEKELFVVNKRSADLKKQVDTLQTEQGVDDEIRAKFNVVKAGESVAVILNNTTTLSASSSVIIEETWWGKFIGVFH